MLRHRFHILDKQYRPNNRSGQFTKQLFRLMTFFFNDIVLFFRSIW